jgi:hypothetical protein
MKLCLMMILFQRVVTFSKLLSRHNIISLIKCLFVCVSSTSIQLNFSRVQLSCSLKERSCDKMFVGHHHQLK